MVIDVRLLQLSNIAILILVMLLGKITEVKLLQAWKAYSPILVTLPKIVMLVSPLHPKNADHPILASPLIVTVFNDVGMASLFPDKLVAPKT